MTRPTVVFITQAFPPETNAAANRSGSIAGALAEFADLTVLTLLPSYPTPEYHFGRTTPHDHSESVPFRLIRTRPFHPHRGAFLLRAVRELVMAGRLGLRAVQQQADTYVVTSPSVFVALVAAVVSALRRAPLVIDIRDLTWDYVSDEARSRESQFLWIMSSVLRYAARIALNRATKVSVSNVGIRAALVELGIDDENILEIPNGVASDVLTRALALRDPLNDPSRFVVVYAGAIGYYQGIETLLEVACEMPDVEFRIIGDGPNREKLVEETHKRGLSNVSLPGFVDRDSVFAHYEEADILFAQLRDLEVLERATFPSKPFEYMATGRPIVYAARGISADFLAASGSALIAEPDNADSIQEAIRSLIEDEGLRRSLGQAGRSTAPRFRRETAMAHLAEAVAAIAAARR